MRFADVVVNVKTDPRVQFFTYKIPPNLIKDIKIGQIVSVPFGQKTLRGYIIRLKNQTQIEGLKEINQIIAQEPVLLPQQIKLAFWLAQYYYAPFLNCLKLMFPPLVKKSMKITNQLSFKPPRGAGSRFAGQTLILVPTVDKIFQVAQEQKKISKGIAIYHNQLSRTERYSSWRKVYDGSADIIIGTRLALFLPFQNLTKIILYDEHDSNYKEQRSPYYYAVSVAEKLAKIWKTPLVLESETPRVETFWDYQNKKDFKLEQTKSNSSCRVQIVLVFNELLNVLKQKIQRKEKVLIFSFSKTEQKKFKEEIRKNFGQLSNISYTTSLYTHACLPNPALTRICSQASSSPAASALPILYPLVVLTSADTLLNLPDFRASEKTFQAIWHLKNLTLGNGLFLIQTYNAEHPAVKFGTKQDYWEFYQSEIAERKMLFYPPFATLIKLSVSAKKEKTAKLAAEKLYQLLQQKLTNFPVSGQISILGPIPAQNLPGKFKYNILLKAKKREDLEPFLALVPKNWMVNVDPESLR